MALFLVMRHHHASHTDLFDDVDQLQLRPLTQLGIQRTQRFIEQQQFWPFGQTARQRNALLLAARQLVWLALRIRFELHQLQHLRDALFDLRLGHAITVQTKGNVVPHRQVREQGVALEHHVDGALIGREAHDVLARQQDLAGGGCLESRQHA